MEGATRLCGRVETNGRVVPRPSRVVRAHRRRRLSARATWARNLDVLRSRFDSLSRRECRRMGTPPSSSDAEKTPTFAADTSPTPKDTKTPDEGNHDCARDARNESCVAWRLSFETWRSQKVRPTCDGRAPRRASESRMPSRSRRTARDDDPERPKERPSCSADAETRATETPASNHRCADISFGPPNHSTDTPTCAEHVAT